VRAVYKNAQRLAVPQDIGMSELAVCADAIDAARVRIEGGTSSRLPTEQAIDELIEALRKLQTSGWLEPRADTSDGKGSGPKHACYQLLDEIIEGIKFSTIRDYIKEAERFER
jgi:hypothetical protein